MQVKSVPPKARGTPQDTHTSTQLRAQGTHTLAKEQRHTVLSLTSQLILVLPIRSSCLRRRCRVSLESYLLEEHTPWFSMILGRQGLRLRQAEPDNEPTGA